MKHYLIVLLTVFACGCLSNNKKEKKSSMSTPIPQPGVSNPNTANPNCKISFAQAMTSPQLSVQRSVATAKINTSFNLQSQSGLLQLTTVATLADYKAPLNAAKNTAEAEVQKLNIAATGTLLTGKWEDAFKTQPSAASIKCTLYPIVSIKQTRGSGSPSVVNFSPYAPYVVSPAELTQTYATELKSEIVFNTITATVVEAGDTGRAVGSKISGTVKIIPVDPKTYGGQVAYRVEANFSDFETTVNLGLLPAATYYISNGKFTAIVIETNTDPKQIIYR